MTKLLVRTSLPYLDKSQFLENPHDLLWFQNRDPGHLGNYDLLRADELCLQERLLVLEKHCYDLYKVFAKLLHCSTLGVGSRKAGNVADEQTSFLILLDNRRECFHHFIVIRFMS